MTTFSSLREAARYAGVSQQSILLWTDKYGIGRMENGRWLIDKERLDRVIAARDHIAEIEASIRKIA